MMAQGQRRAFWQQLLADRLKRKHSCRNASVSTNHMASLDNQLPHQIFQNCVHELFLENKLIPFKRNLTKIDPNFYHQEYFPNLQLYNRLYQHDFVHARNPMRALVHEPLYLLLLVK